MNLGIGSDHAGFLYKEKLRAWLTQQGHTVKDFGTFSEETVDYPLFIRPVALAVASGECERGIVLGGSGNGEAMAANRVIGVRCALCWNVESARLGRRHNDANVLSIGQRMMDYELALEIVKMWLETPFEGGRHLESNAARDVRLNDTRDDIRPRRLRGDDHVDAGRARIPINISPTLSHWRRKPVDAASSRGHRW